MKTIEISEIILDTTLSEEDIHPEVTYNYDSEDISIRIWTTDISILNLRKSIIKKLFNNFAEDCMFMKGQGILDLCSGMFNMLYQIDDVTLICRCYIDEETRIGTYCIDEILIRNSIDTYIELLKYTPQIPFPKGKFLGIGTIL